MDLIKEAYNISEEIIEIRRRIHQNPEMGNQEFETSALIENYLKGLGLETSRPTETAIMGILKGKAPGKTIGFRADMDALPVTENTGCSFASKIQGRMHACGHDVHTSGLLGAAKLLSLHKDELKGNVRFFFEPDEEGEGGAERMVQAGCMEGVSAAYGAHVSPALPLGTVGVRFGKFYAASHKFNVTVKGKSAHGAEPEKGIDALVAACEMVQALKKLPAGFPKGEAVLSVGTFNSGTARNIISDKAEFTGIIRTLGKDVREGMIDAFNKTINEISSRYGTVCEVKIFSSHYGITNTDKETRLAEEAFKTLPGIKVVEIEEPTLTSEDFGFFADAAGAGSFYHIGAGSSYPLHSDKFLPDDKAALYAAACHAAVALKELS